MGKPVRFFVKCLAALFLVTSCTNPMVNFLLGNNEKIIEPVPPVKLALWNGSWYSSLQEAVDAADDGIAGTPSKIEVRLDIKNYVSLGGSTITLSAGKHIRLVPYLPDLTSFLIERWQGTGALFVIEDGASLSLGQGAAISGAGIPADSALVKIEAGGEFNMENGSELRKSILSGGSGSAVYAEYDSSLSTVFTITGSACITDGDVYLESDNMLEEGAMITLKGNVSNNPVALICPQHFNKNIQVLDGVSSILGSFNNSRFDVTPEEVPGWDGPRYWRVGANGKLQNVVARLTNENGSIAWFTELQNAVYSAFYNSPDNLQEITIVSNIDLGAGQEVLIDSGYFLKLTVPEGKKYIIRRIAGPVTKNVFNININAVLELSAPVGSELVIDGGAVWYNDISPAVGGINSEDGIVPGIKSNQALVYVDRGSWEERGSFILGPRVVLRNNDRTYSGGGGNGGSGGGVEARGSFLMTGGKITHNRAGGYGGGILLNEGDSSLMKNISGGEITDNDAVLGGGIMLALNSRAKLTMSGGLIRGNRASGTGPGGVPPVNINFTDGFKGLGGAVFIPRTNETAPGGLNAEFHLRGGIISNNVSESGFGNGIAMDDRWTIQPKLTLSGSFQIINNDICLRNQSSPPASVDGPLYNTVKILNTVTAPPIEVTMDPMPSTSAGITGPKPVIATGAYFYAAQFTTRLHYAIGSDGNLYYTP